MKTPLRLRTAQICDAEAVAALWHASLRITCAPAYGYDEMLLSEWADSKTAENVAALIHAEDIFMVAERENRICGFFCASFDLGTFALFVDPAYQGQGIGTRLFRCCLKCYQTMTESCSVFRFHSSLNAVTFYRKLGAKIAGDTVSLPYPCVPMEISTESFG